MREEAPELMMKPLPLAELSAVCPIWRTLMLTTAGDTCMSQMCHSPSLNSLSHPVGNSQGMLTVSVWCQLAQSDRMGHVICHALISG